MKNNHGLFITGTDTDVGKTIFTSVLAGVLDKKGYDFGIQKPIQTGMSNEKCTDLEVYKKFTKIKDNENLVIPERFREPQAPIISAELENRKVRIENIMESFYILNHKHKNMLIEGIGGVMVPITNSVMVVDLIRIFRLPVLIVSRPTLGTINHTCLTADFLKRRGIAIAGIVFSGVVQSENSIFIRVMEQIKRISRVPILGYLEKHDFFKSAPDGIVKRAEKTLKLDGILKFFKK